MRLAPHRTRFEVTKPSPASQLLYAACLEQGGINPLLVTEGHAFAGLPLSGPGRPSRGFRGSGKPHDARPEP
jgi:hypothetical protein